MFRYIYILIFLLSGMYAPAQKAGNDLFFSVLNTGNGLSQNCITAICQDSGGDLWFGTNDGLNRYDGYGFKIYRKVHGDPATLSGNQVRSIACGSGNTLWILTENGLDKWDELTERISHYPLKERISHLLTTRRGDLLALTPQRLYRYTADSLQPVINAASRPFLSITEDRNGQLYIGLRGGGILAFTAGFQPAGEHLLPGADKSGITHLHTDTENRLWAVIGGQAIGNYDSLRRKFTPIPDKDYALIDRDIRAITDFDSTQLLAGTFNGLFFIDKRTGRVTPASPATGQEGELSHFSIFSLYKDRQNTLWVGTNTGGVNYYSTCNNRFGFIQPAQFSGLIGMGREDRDGCLWFATEGGGLLSYDPASRTQHNYLLNSDARQAFNNNIIKAIHLSGDTILCSTHRGEVYAFPIRTKQFRLICDFKMNNIYGIYRDTQGSLWIPTNTGRGLVRLKAGQATDKFRENGKNTSLYYVTVIAEPVPGQLLFGTENKGLYHFDLRTEQLTRIPASRLGLPADTRLHITAIYADSARNIWIATAGNGLFLLDRDLHLQLPAQNLPLSGEKILSIAESPAGQFWFTTSRGLFRYHRQTGTCEEYNTPNGLPSQEFSTNSALLSRSGTLYLPGNKGITTTDTRHFPVNAFIPPVRLTTLRINNREVRPDTNNPILRHPLRFTSSVTLRPGETNIAIGYTAANHIHPHSNRYAYRLEGIDPDWIEAGERREAIYSNLPPGNYTFRVKASNNDGLWNPQDVSLRIRVLAPLWLRWWAFALYALAAFGIIRQYFVYHQRKQALEHQLRYKQLQQEQAEEIHRERLRFFTRVAHEFRTPLTLIVNPLDELSEKTVHISGVKESLTLIRKNAQRLLSLVDDLLNLQKQENGKAELHPAAFDFHEFIQELYYTFQGTAHNRGITFRLSMENMALPVIYDRNELEKVVFNLLSNAFKFTPSGGTVTLSAALLPFSGESDGNTAPGLQIEVQDNGIGIRPEDRNRLFEPFSVSGQDLHGKIPGSGIGLSVARFIVGQHGGTLTLRESEPQGTIARVRLPYRPATLPAGNLPGIVPETAAGNLADNTPATEQAHLRLHRLLIVDDNRDILAYLSSQLEKEYKVRTAANGQEALTLANSETVDLIISDIMMPVMDGNELCRAIKAAPELCHIPVILLTAKAMSLHIEEGFNAGADDYLVKPFKISALKARIRNILAERERLKEIYSQKLSLKSAGIEVEPIDKTFMEKYIAIVRENISNPDFSVENLCRELGMSRAAFYRKTKAVTTLSPAETIRSIRLECAATLLRTTTLSAAEIAFQVGFGSYAHFSTYFKSTYGITPKEYREK